MTDFVLTPVELVGEGFDRAYETPSGNRFRARVIQRQMTSPVRNAAPTGLTLQITLALLEADNSVARIGNGYRIFDPVEIVLTGFGMGSDAPIDVEALILREITLSAAAAERLLANQAAVLEHLSTWGLGLPPASPLMPALGPSTENGDHP